MRKLTGTIGAVVCVISGAAHAAVIDFDDNALAPDSFYAPNQAEVWTSGGVGFNHGWNFDCCWAGFTYSNQTDTTTPGFGNDRSAITGDGVGAGQDNYAVGYTGSDEALVFFDSAVTVQGAYFTNATYPYLAMANGDDGNDPAFVKGPFTDGDFFELTVIGLDEFGQALGSVNLLLADGANVVDEWVWLDMSSLGEVHGLNFALASSDNGTFGMNTPAYFAMDSMSVVPLPAAAWMFLSALGALFARRRVSA